MPIYEFQCKECRQITEKIMKMSDPTPKSCDCGASNSLEKLVSMTSFVLKGTGWYETDFKDSGTGQPKRDDKDDSSPNNKATVGKSPAVTTKDTGSSPSPQPKTSESTK